MTLRDALNDPLVQKAVDELTLELDLTDLDDPEHPEHDPLVSNRRVHRAVTSSDYVIAIRAVQDADPERLPIDGKVTVDAVTKLLEEA